MKANFLDKICQLDPKEINQKGYKKNCYRTADTHYITGSKHEKNGNISAAIQSYTTALMLNSNHALAYYCRGTLNVSFSSPYTDVEKGLKDLYTAQNLFFEQMDFKNYQRAKSMIGFVRWSRFGFASFA